MDATSTCSSDFWFTTYNDSYCEFTELMLSSYADR